MKKLAIVALLSAFAAWPPARADEKHPLVPSITVVGSGKASAAPDMAVIQVGVVTQAASAAKALQQNNAAMEKLLQVLEAQGVAKKDVQTSSFSVQPQYKPYQPGQTQPSEIVGYQVGNQVRAKVRKLDSLGKILDDVVSQGANQVQGVTFSVAEPNPLPDQARRQAMADARRKAELYAEAAGVELGRVLLIQEETPQRPRPLFANLAKGAAEAVPIAVGEEEFAATVTVTYAIGKEPAAPKATASR